MTGCAMSDKTRAGELSGSRPSRAHTNFELGEETMTDTVKYLLDESRIPKYWYNIAADLPVAAPPVLHPGHAPAGGTG